MSAQIVYIRNKDLLEAILPRDPAQAWNTERIAKELGLDGKYARSKASAICRDLQRDRAAECRPEPGESKGNLWWGCGPAH